MNWIYAFLVASSPLVIGEFLHKLLTTKKEVARKTVHVLGGVAASLLVVFLELNEIVILMAVFVLVLALVRRYRLVKALYNVKRVSYGEIFFPLGVGLGALIAPNEMIYVYSVLIMGLSDTAAGIIGNRFGKKAYVSFGKYKKTIAGSSAFLVTTLIIGIVFYFIADTTHLGLLVVVSVLLTVVEAVAPYGTDNAALPLVGALVGGSVFV